MNALEIQKLLVARGFEEYWYEGNYDRKKVKVLGFSHSRYGVLYLKRNPNTSDVPSTKMPLVISGGHEDKFNRSTPSRNYLDWDHAKPVYYNSNLRGFPSRVNPNHRSKNANPSETRYGISFNVDSEQGLNDLLRWLADEDIDVHNIETYDRDNPSYEDVRVLREIKTRRGQPTFRKELLIAYNRQCCVTACKVEAILEAAHIVSHSEETNYSVDNGLLLRADIHTLYDLDLIAIDCHGRVHIHIDLIGSEYEHLDQKVVLKNISNELKENLKRRREGCGFM